MVLAAPFLVRIASLLGPAAWLMGLCLILMTGGPARAQEAPPEDGLFITVPNPITSDVVNRIKAKTSRALDRTDRRIRKIVYDFNPDRHQSNTKDYGPCHDLAAYLLDLQQVATIAYVHHEVTGHTVLPVLACRQLVMSADGRLGDVLRNQERPLRKDQAQFYEELASLRGRCPAIVAKMFDKDLEVVEATRKGAVWWIDARNSAAEATKGVIVTRKEPVLIAGQTRLYSATEAEKYNLCDLTGKESRQEVAEAYQLSPTSLREDPLEGRTPIARRIVLTGKVDKAFAEKHRRRLRQLIAQRVNLIVLQLECSGGDVQVARDFADHLRTLKDDEGDLPVMTVAYIPERAPDTATFIAFGCTEIVMRRKAEIGDFENMTFDRRDGRRVPLDPERYRMMRESLMGLAQEQGYPPLLAQAMLDRQVSVYRVQSQKGKAEWRLVTDRELRMDANDHKWGNRILNKPGGDEGRLLKLDGVLAKELGIAHDVVDDVGDLRAKYGLEKLADAGPDWLDRFAEMLRHPVMAVFLVMVGIACLILELKMPGVGLPGVIAALCFVLYFWAHSQLAGQITMLAVLLFVLGLILVGVEVFIFPGFGVTGISGILLVLLSLALVTLEKKPETSQEWLSFGRTLSTFGFGLMGAMGMAFVVAWYLPHIPYANRLVLRPPSDESEQALEDDLTGASSGGVALASLLGAVGVAVTTLRPAGLARFGEDFVDVMAEGSFVEAGARVQIIEIEGNRIVVKEV